MTAAGARSRPAWIRQDLPAIAEGFEFVVIDLPGRVGKRQGAAMMVADLVIVVSGPSTLDVWALAASAEVVTEAQAVRPKLLAAVLLNKRAHNTESRAARDALASVGLPVLEASGSQSTGPERLPTNDSDGHRREFIIIFEAPVGQYAAG